MWRFLQGFLLRDFLFLLDRTIAVRVTYASSGWASHLHPEPLLAIQLEFRGSRGCSIVCRLRLHQMLLPSKHGRTHGFL
ncbi:hypothetical protein LINPERPRIM_LOCUS24133 [Linum perenne]